MDVKRIRGKTEQEIFRFSVVITLGFTSLLWIIMAFHWALDFDFKYLGILPRTWKGMVGILTGPLVHGDIFHLLSNSFPILILGIAVFYFYYRIAAEVVAWIYLTTGFWVWLIGRDAYHIGASGIVYGVAAFLFFSGIFRRNYRLLTVTLIVLFLYGGMIYGLFPNRMEPEVSWESHLLGALSGILLAFYFRKEKVIDDYLETDEEELVPDDEEMEDQSYYSKPTATIDINYQYEVRRRSKKSSKNKGK